MADRPTKRLRRVFTEDSADPDSATESSSEENSEDDSYLNTKNVYVAFHFSVYI